MEPVDVGHMAPLRPPHPPLPGETTRIGAVNAEGSPTNHKLEFVSLGPHAEIVDTTSCAIAMCPPHFGNQSPRGMGRTPCLQVV
jgi:hypothetical protein